MDPYLHAFASTIARLLEGLVACSIVVGAAGAVFSVALLCLRRQAGHDSLVAVREALAVWLSLALEFALAADILLTVLAPTWRELSTLAAIVVLRAVINFSIERDLATSAARSVAPTVMGTAS